MVDTITLFYLSVVFFMITTIWFLIESTKSYKFLAVYMAVALGLSVSSIFLYNSILGSPTSSDLPKAFAMVSFYVDEEKAIYLYVIPEKETVPKSFVRPYSRKEHEKLESMRQGVEAGRVIGKVEPSGKNSNSTESSRETEVKFYDLADQNMRLKQ